MRPAGEYGSGDGHVANSTGVEDALHQLQFQQPLQLFLQLLGAATGCSVLCCAGLTLSTYFHDVVGEQSLPWPV